MEFDVRELETKRVEMRDDVTNYMDHVKSSMVDDLPMFETSTDVEQE